MADESGAQTSKPQERKQEKRISREEALEGARALTGQSRHIVAGALAGDSRQSFTENQLQRLVREYVGRPEDQSDVTGGAE